MRKFIPRLGLVILLVCLPYNISWPDDSATMGNTHVLTIHVDRNSHVLWNWKRELPQYILSDSAIRIPETPYINFSALHRIVGYYAQNFPRLAVIITPHPLSNYMVVDKVLDVIDLVENRINRQRAAASGVAVDSLPNSERYAMQYGLAPWQDRDSRIMEAVRKQTPVIPDPRFKIPKDRTFQYQFDHGHWDSRKPEMLDLSSPRIIPPPGTPGMG